MNALCGRLMGLLILAPGLCAAAEARARPPHAAPARAQQPAATLADLLEKAGQDYLAARQAILDMGDAALPFLAQAEARQDWHAKTFAQNLICRLQHPDQVEQLQESFPREVLAARRRFGGAVVPRWWQEGFPSLSQHPAAVPYFAEVLLKDRRDAAGGSLLVPVRPDHPYRNEWPWDAKRAAIVALADTNDDRVPAILGEFVTQGLKACEPGALDRPARALVLHACSELGTLGDEHTVTALRGALEERLDKHTRNSIAYTIRQIEGRLAREQQARSGGARDREGEERSTQRPPATPRESQ